MKIYSFLIIVIGVFLVLPWVQALANDTNSVYERVINSKTIRCGYNVWPPYISKDPNTGELSGLSYEYMKAVGKELDLKIEWAEETGWGDFQEGLNSNRFDLMCVTVWQSGQRSKVALLTTPIYLNSMFACAREGDDRFSKSVGQANAPEVTVAYVENDVAEKVKENQFPKSKGLALPQYSDPAQVMLSVSTKKADVSLCDLDNLKSYNANTSKKLKPIAQTSAVRNFATVLAVKKGEYAFKHMLDSTIGALEVSGQAEKIVKPYEPTFTMIKD